MDYNLDRFIQAQVHSYYMALEEIKRGRKRSHWIWYIFPQLKGLGRSSNAIYYGIENIEEARMYLSHPILGARLKEISEALLALETSDPYDVMDYVDVLKLRSSMTLFAQVDGYDSVFGRVIEKYFKGNKDAKTIQILQGDNI